MSLMTNIFISSCFEPPSIDQNTLGIGSVKGGVARKSDVKKIKFVYFVHVHPKAFHPTGYKQNLFFLPLPAILKNYLRSLLRRKCQIYKFKGSNHKQMLFNVGLLDAELHAAASRFVK